MRPYEVLHIDRQTVQSELVNCVEYSSFLTLPRRKLVFNQQRTKSLNNIEK